MNHQRLNGIAICQRRRGTVTVFAFLLCLFYQMAGLAEDVYRLNPGDGLEITVWQEDNLRTEAVVLPDGTISFPLAGVVAAAGKTTDELEGILTERLAKYLSEPEVNVRLRTTDGNSIYVAGEVARPGTFVMKGPTDVMQALSLAGGLTQFAKKNDIIILRRGPNGATKSFAFSYGDIEDGENLNSNILLQSGDTVVVP